MSQTRTYRDTYSQQIILINKYCIRLFTVPYFEIVQKNRVLPLRRHGGYLDF